MTSRRAIVHVGGTLTELPAADTLAGAGAFTRASSAPSSPAVGDRWLHATTGVEYTWVDDGTSSQWVEL